MTEEQTPPPAGEPGIDLVAELTADPMVLASAVLVALGLLLLLVGVAGSWHWRAAIWGAVLASVAAFGLVAYSANQRRTQFPTDPDAGLAEDAASTTPSAPIELGKGRGRGRVKEAAPEAVADAGPDALEGEPPPRPRFAGFGKPKPEAAPVVKPPPPQPTNVQVMQVQGSNVRVAPTPAPMPISKPERPAAKPPSTPPATPPTIQVGVPREPGFPTYQPIAPDAPVIQVRNRYHRPDCRYVAVAAADDAVQTTVGEARASNAMPCGVCRP